MSEMSRELQGAIRWIQAKRQEAMKGDLRDERLIKIADSLVESYQFFSDDADFFAWVDELAFRLAEVQDFREYVERKVDEQH